MTIIIIIAVIVVLGLIGLAYDESDGGNSKNNSNNYRSSNPPRPIPPRPTPPRPKPPQNLDEILRELQDSRDNYSATDPGINGEMKITEEAVKRVQMYAPQSLNLGIDELMKKVTVLVDYAERISGNANPDYFKKGSDKFIYDEHLWYRARLAGLAFKQAAELVNLKLDQLHKISFNNISGRDRQKIMQLQASDGLPALRRSLLNNAITMFRINKNIKELIRVHCGKGGSEWAKKMDESGDEARS